MTPPLRLLPALALLLPGCLAAHVAPDGRRAGRTVRVSGEGRAAARPDVALASFGVEAVSRQLADASREADERMRAILAALAQAGVAGADVQTTRYDVAVERRYDQKSGAAELVGYRVSTEVRATLRDLPRVGAVLEAVVRAGGNAIHSLAFQKEDPRAEISRARAAAVAAARVKAEELARAAGAELGPVLEMSEGGGRAPVPMVRAMAAQADGAPVEPGQLELTVTVEATYALRSPRRAP